MDPVFILFKNDLTTLRIYENSIQSHLSAVNFVMRGIFLSNSVKSFLNAEKYVIISKYCLGNYTVIKQFSYLFTYDELLDLKNSYYYEKYLMSSVCKRKHWIQRTPFFQILCMQSPPQNESKITFIFENNNSGNCM